jgi:opacity protein-like surface antigen
MKQTIIIKSLLIAGATLLGFAATSRAQDPVPATGKMGLLGQTYAGLDYSYVDFDNSPTNADSFGFQYNQALSAGLDGLLTYDWTQTGLVLGDRARQQTIGGALRAFSTSYSWGKPYVEAGGGWTWVKYAGIHDNSFTWEVAVGSEFQVAPKVTVTPYVRYEDAPDLSDSDTWNFGVKANYWVNTQWAVTAGINYDDSHDTAYTVGTNFRF